jgi:hypothetical protein
MEVRREAAVGCRHDPLRQALLPALVGVVAHVTERAVQVAEHGGRRHELDAADIGERAFGDA